MRLGDQSFPALSRLRSQLQLIRSRRLKGASPTTAPRLGDKDTGLADSTAGTSKYRVYADQTDDQTPSNMPQSRLRTLYPQCPKAGSKG